MRRQEWSFFPHGSHYCRILFLLIRERVLTIPTGKQQLPIQDTASQGKKASYFYNWTHTPSLPSQFSVCKCDKIQGSIKTQLPFKSYLKAQYLLPTLCLQDSDGGADLPLEIGNLYKLIHFFGFPLQVLQFLHMNHNTEEITKLLIMHSTQSTEP